jgi:hypothetical protein
MISSVWQSLQSMTPMGEIYLVIGKPESYSRLSVLHQHQRLVCAEQDPSLWHCQGWYILAIEIRMLRQTDGAQFISALVMSTSHAFGAPLFDPNFGSTVNNAVYN